MPEFPIADGFYIDDSPLIASKKCINWVPQIPLTQALSIAQLKGTEGIIAFADTGNGTSRGYHVMNEIAYSINGDSLFRINSNGSTDNLGQIAGSERVSIANNGEQMCMVVPNAKAYIYSIALGLVEITDSNYVTTLGPSEQVKHVDGYFVHFNNKSNASSSPIFFKSALKDGLTFSALDFGTAEADPDKITGIHVSRSQLYVTGTKTIEPFANVGGAGFPFKRISGAVVPRGVKAKNSLVDFNESYVFIGGGENEQASVWQFTGTSALKISTQAIDSIIQSLSSSEQEQIFATTFSVKGSFFVNFHIGDRVMTFDFTASTLAGSPRWHERQSLDVNGELTRWRVNGIMTAYGKTLVTDTQDGRIGELRSDVYSEYDQSVPRIFSITPFSNEGKRVAVTRMEITTESGAGLISINPKINNSFPYTFPFNFHVPEDVSDIEPMLFRSYSDDGGKTWSNITGRKIGKVGEFNKRQIWRMDGQFRRFRTYEFTLNAKIKPVIINLIAEFK